MASARSATGCRKVPEAPAADASKTARSQPSITHSNKTLNRPGSIEARWFESISNDSSEQTWDTETAKSSLLTIRQDWRSRSTYPAQRYTPSCILLEQGADRRVVCSVSWPPDGGGLAPRG